MGLGWPVVQLLFFHISLSASVYLGIAEGASWDRGAGVGVGVGEVPTVLHKVFSHQCVRRLQLGCSDGSDSFASCIYLLWVFFFPNGFCLDVGTGRTVLHRH